MEELLGGSGSMATNNSSSSSTLRFLELLKQPGPVSFTQIRNPDPVELHESDVVWSFSAVSSDSYSYTNSTIQSSPAHHHRRRFNPAKSGLSAALSDDNHHLIRRKSTVNSKIIPPETRQEDIPAKFHQSAPVNFPVWPKEFRDKYKNDNRFDEVEDDDEGIGEEEMVPPHVIVARSHVTFSVFEGAGRTLKGRDLRRVRNAVFQKTGFID
ncbi:hypothetical protein CDL12_10801 [Handroanthus impetiginosus]|uniref:Senescence regulator S40 n=1 Tax=Handroanthus impetiginosus TaxID=429701 RepID=A0A2G9HG89_9LAMI|nr:hypothetical protein CDL12_10801 [Handroanthus impetiginosus]